MQPYCPFTFKTERFKTREVLIGQVGIGGLNPIRIQSMTTSDTRDAVKTAEQAMKLADAGCEMVRVTVQGMAEAYSCETIKSILVQKGYSTPLIADIHFFPKAALTVADFVDKVRINPGNFVDKRASFKKLEYTDESYQQELRRLEDIFSPLVEKCKKLKVAMRIGTNHGSLSDRVMNRYGNSPMGMVISALEFTEVCRKLDFHQIVYSMKSSNTHIMIQAYRLLMKEMLNRGWDYPLHLGVTEAGMGEEGRIKSSVGIGALLLDGIGDTIRVSLTEDPWYEIQPCKELIALSQDYLQLPKKRVFIERARNPFQYTKWVIPSTERLFHPEGSVAICVTEKDLLQTTLYTDLECEKEKLSLSSANGLLLEEAIQEPRSQEVLKELQEKGFFIFSSIQPEYNTHSVSFISEKDPDWKSKINPSSQVMVLELQEDKLHFAREVVDYLKQNPTSSLVLLKGKYPQTNQDLSMRAAAELGALLCDGLAVGIAIDASHLSIREKRLLALNILQASRLRAFKTEFISCPSCGRTLFELQEVTRRVQEHTSHLSGVKIAVMGCIVNGPGEMADADFGYVGSKPGKVDLYIGHHCVEKDIPHQEAVSRLIDLIKKEGKWIEKDSSMLLSI